MTSAINPNNIDGAYPIAGQPNNTQGMRDNFTATKTNFQYAADEITDLQSKVVAKSALTGGTLDNNMNDNLIYAVKLNDVSYTYLQNTATAGTVTVDYSAGQFQYITTTGSVSLGFANWPVAGDAGSIDIAVNITNTAYTLTLPLDVRLGITGIQGIAPGTVGVSNTITFAATGLYQFRLFTADSGNTITIFDLNRPLLAAEGQTIGYQGAAGTGGTVTQATNKATGVTLNKPVGQITLNNASLAAATTVNFTLTNSYIGNTDLLILNQTSTANAGGYYFNAICNAGNAQVSVRNIMAASASDAVVLRYAVVKGEIA
jgi:hypothetical protein